MNSRHMAIMLAALAVLFVGVGVYNLNRMPASRYPEVHGSFALNSAAGPVSSKQMRGKVGIIYFGYTHCPDVCPDTLGRIGAALKLLDERQLARVMAVFITTDPARDSPELLASYVRHFDSHLIGLSGDADSIAAAARSYLAGYRKADDDKRGNYMVTHSSYIIIVRPDGQIAEFMSHTTSPDKIAEAIRYWLRWT